MSPTALDEAFEHDRWWHEDDVVHQAEGMLSIRLGLPIEQAAAALRAYARHVGRRRRAVAAEIVNREVVVPWRGLGREKASSRSLDPDA